MEQTVKIVEFYNMKEGTALVITDRLYQKVMRGEQVTDEDLKGGVIINNINEAKHGKSI